MSAKQQSILLGGAVVALLSTSYLSFINYLCCLGVIIGAVVAVWHYTSTNSLTVKPGEGAVMGLMAGVVGALIALVLNYVIMQMGIRHDQAMLNVLMDSFRDAMPPEQYDELVRQRDQPLRLGSYLASGMIGVLVSGLFGAIGGAIGAAMFKKGTDGPTGEVSGPAI